MTDKMIGPRTREEWGDCIYAEANPQEWRAGDRSAVGARLAEFEEGVEQRVASRAPKCDRCGDESRDLRCPDCALSPKEET